MGLFDEGEPEVLLEHQAITRRRNPIPLLVGFVALGALLISQWPTGADTAVTPPPSTTTPTSVPEVVSSTPPFSFPQISLVKIPAAGGLAIDVPFSTPRAPRPLTHISSFELDASGTYMAALGTYSILDAPRQLFAGSVERGFEAISPSTRGFAWHDTEPGQLAFIDGSLEGAASFRLLDLTLEDPEQREVGSVTGWLSHYGAWGFSTFEMRRPDRWFRIFDPDGQLILDREAGKAVGFVPTLGMVATLADGTHVAIDPTTGATRALPTFESQAVLWNIETGGQRGTYAVQASSRDFTTHRVLIYNRLNEVIARLDSGSSRQVMTWNGDGTKLIYAIDNSSDRTSLVVYDVTDGTTIETSFVEDPDNPRTIGILVD
jgi:hypothetical protein